MQTQNTSEVNYVDQLASFSSEVIIITTTTTTMTIRQGLVLDRTVPTSFNSLFTGLPRPSKVFRVTFVGLAYNSLLLLLLLFDCNWVDTRWQQYNTHLHTQTHTHTVHRTQVTEHTNQLKIKKKLEINWEVRAVTRLCELYPGICLTTEEKTRKYLS
jgi:hypothetical protein